MTTHGRYAAQDGSFASSTGNAATRGLALIVVAVLIGFLLLWQGGVGGSGSDEVSTNDTAAAGGGADDSGGAAADDVSDDAGDDTTDDQGTTDDQVAAGDDATTTTAPITTTTRPLGEVKVAVANGVGEAGLAGARGEVLNTAGYVTAAVNAATSPTELSAVYYVDGYGPEASGVAAELGATDAVLRVAPADLAGLVSDPADVADFHIFVVLGADRVLG